ncbi:MAG: response regulator transcription factor [Desulfosarcina sp.]|nr:response regulator transcription factor [Desulfosarcina sp.]
MLERKKILIVDQSTIFRRTLKEVIKAIESQIDVREAKNADQAKAILKKEPPDVVFLDIALPRENGIEFIASIKDMIPTSRIVVLTSHDSAEHEAASIQKGADYFLSKERSGGLRLIDAIHTAICKDGSA